MVLATNSSSATVGQKLILGDYVDNDSYRDEWEISKLEAALLAIPESYDRSSYFGAIADDLSGIGYEACFNNHSTISDGITCTQLIDYMKESRILLLRTHGNRTSVNTSDGLLTRNYLLTLPSDTFTRLELVIYGACRTGEGGREGNNLLTATIAAGARTALGFENRVESGACNVWCEAFFEGFADYYSNSQMDYYDVCGYADSVASDHRWYEYENDDGNLVSLRNFVVVGATSLPNG